jgi:hypothetical protein
MYTCISRTIRTYLVMFDRYKVCGVALLGKDKEGVHQVGDIIESPVSRVITKEELPTKELLHAVRKHLGTFKQPTQDKFKPWMYVFLLLLYKFGANFISRLVVDWLQVAKDARSTKEHCARVFAGALRFDGVYLEAVIAPPEESAPETEIEEDIVAEGIYISSSNSPLRKRMFVMQFAHILTIFAQGNPKMQQRQKRVKRARTRRSRQI